MLQAAAGAEAGEVFHQAAGASAVVAEEEVSADSVAAALAVAARAGAGDFGVQQVAILYWRVPQNG